MLFRSTQYSTSTIGGSAYFDGSGDYLTTASSSAFTLATSNFTFETWVYLPATGSYYNVLRGTTDNSLAVISFINYSLKYRLI